MSDEDEPEVEEGEREVEAVLAKALTADWLERKVRVRTGRTVIIEDVLTGISHFGTYTRLHFKETKSYASLLSQDQGYTVPRDEIVTVIP